ncbi:MAG: hypothetical protein H7Y19_14045 [Luteimonas sp.]|nr:hypothetical protein [Luteimonas sp.]
MPALLRHAACAAILVALSACATTPSAPGNAPSTGTNAVQATPAHAFFADLSALCGKAYPGRVVVDTPTPAKDPFAGKSLVMHVRECSADAIRIPFHVGDDRSRTWVVTRTPSALRLKHDHRHQDGSEDAVTQYGGDTVGAGTAQRQAFPADAASKAMFLREGLAVSVDNTWAIEWVPGRSFTYELSRPNGRLFRVEFDLTRTVAAPPPPWGAAKQSPPPVGEG